MQRIGTKLEAVIKILSTELLATFCLISSLCVESIVQTAIDIERKETILNY